MPPPRRTGGTTRPRARFHDTRQGRRFTIAPDVQVEVLDRLLQLNHERYAEEVRQGLHAKKKAGGPRPSAPRTPSISWNPANASRMT
ncbi:MAG TPA: hypothetical protein VN327_03320 [Pseudonocardiaceae bacterium]|jgi:hypothetical protein|nr:hypothetical protein [Pseudonocardiaceae bacterium]